MALLSIVCVCVRSRGYEEYNHEMSQPSADSYFM